MKLILLNFLFLNVLFLNGQQKDSVYFIQFVSEEDGSGVPFTDLYCNGIRYWSSDIDGKIKINQSDLVGNKSKLEFKATNLDFEIFTFPFSLLKLNETVLVKLKKGAIPLERIEIIYYKIPNIDPDDEDQHFSRRRKRQLKEEIAKKDTAISYSEKEVMDYAKVLKGKWSIKDSLRNRSVLEYSAWYEYIKRHLTYPQRAHEWEIEETLYISFELNEGGYLENIKLVKGNNPILSVYLIDFITKMPGIKPIQSYQKKPTRTLEYRLPVSFKLD